MHYVGAVCGDHFGLNHRVCDACGSWRVGSGRVLPVGVVSVREMMSFKFLDALTIGF